MTVAAGTRLGPYEVTGAIGAGGMGEVYRGRDAALNRDVAIKVLPAALAGDTERLARFKREAQVLASLNHPNIAHVYGFEAATLADGSTAHFLAMELVEGEDLSERLRRGAIPVDEAVVIARQVAEGLEEAHERGIIHRDLKPANIKVTPDGKVKILDFGLAKALEADPASSAASSQLSHSPTMSRHATEAGMIMGTAPYMSPEQARGKAVDKRADIWAFGVVLFEMLTGQRLFSGETVSDVLAAVLTREIGWTGLPKPIAPAVRQLLGRCLERDPKRRLRDIGEARFALESTSGVAPDGQSDSSGAARARTLRLPWAIASVATILALALWLTGRPAPALSPTVRFDLSWPGDAAAGTNTESDYFDLSPDGSHLAIVAAGKIWVRSLDSPQPRPVAGTENGRYPFWSPDSNSIGFFSGGELRRVARDGGPAQKLCEAQNIRGGAWSSTGTIVFSARGGAGLFRVGDRGGQPVPLPGVKTPDGASGRSRYPQFLPDGRRFLFTYMTASKEAAGVYVGDLDGTPPIRVLDGSDHALYAPGDARGEPGHLLFRRQLVLMAQPFDVRRLQIVGEMFPVAERVGEGNTGHGAFAVSSTGVLAHSEQSREREVLTWIDRSGRRMRTVSGRLALGGFAISPDGRNLAYAGGTPDGRRDVWLQSIDGGSPSRFTFGEGGTGWGVPHWSRDGARVVYATQDIPGEARYEIRTQRVDRTGAEETLVTGSEIVTPWDSSPDGRKLLYSMVGSGLMLLPLEAGAKPITVSEGSFAQFSPDGRFIAYVRSSQIFVQPLPPTSVLWQVSTQGGSMPRWRADGREIFYRAPDGRLMAVPVRPGAGAFEAGAPQAVFDGIPPPGSFFIPYQPANDGQRFLVSQKDNSSQSPITVVLNWRGALRK